MVEDRSMVEQAHEIHMLAKDLKNCSKDAPCVLSDKFVARGIISKMPPSWKDFATSLKHKSQEFTIYGLIGTLDVEEKARAKDARGKGIVGTSSANFVQKNNSHKNKKKPLQNQTKTKQTTTFKKKKKKGACFVCDSRTTLLQSVRIAKARNLPTWSLARLEEHRGTVIYYLQFFQYSAHSSGGWILGLIFMCVLTLLCFLLTRSEGLPPC